MKNYLLLVLIALGASANIAARYYVDENGVEHHTGLFGHRERVAERRGYYDEDGRYYHGGVVTDAAEGAHEIGHEAHVAASNIFHDIF